jgi:hypothetical protein
MNFNFNTPSPESKHVWVMAHYNDRFYEFECLCGQMLIGRTKSDLVANFEVHIEGCETKKLTAKYSK